MKTNKMTYANALGMVLEIQEVKENEELFNKITQLDNQMNKKSGKMSKAEKEKQAENDRIKEQILSTLKIGEEQAKAIKEMQLADELLNEFSNQKISALLRQLIEDGLVVRTEVKRIAKFFLAEEIA